MLTIGIVLGGLAVVTALMMKKRTEAANRPASMGEAAVHSLLGLAALTVLYLAAR